MTTSVKVRSIPPQGGQVVLTIAAVTADKGRITADTWNPGTALTAPPSKSETHDVYNVRRNVAGTQIMCRSREFGPDPEITCLLVDDAASPAVIVTIEGSLGKIADGTKKYVVSHAEFKAIRDFIAASGFAS